MNKSRLYKAGCIFFIPLLITLRTLSLFFSYDTNTGYYDTSALSIIMNAAIVVVIAAFCSAIFVIKKDELLTEFTPNTKSFKVTCGCSFVLTVISLAPFIMQNSNEILWYISIFSTALSAIFYLFGIICKEKFELLRAFFSIALLISLVCCLASLYFDMSITANSPHKTLASISVISALLFVLCETRNFLSKPMPRCHFMFSMITPILGFSFSVSSVLFSFFSQASDYAKYAVSAGGDKTLLIITAVSVYALGRSSAFYSTNEKT